MRTRAGSNRPSEKQPPRRPRGRQTLSFLNLALAAAVAVIILLGIFFVLHGKTATPAAAPAASGSTASGVCAQDVSDLGSTTKQWTAPPPQTIHAACHYTALVHTSMGDMTIKLLPAEAPIAVNNFIFLARHHFYDQTKFHRIVQGFVIQGGDPTGTGTGGPGYSFQVETPKPTDAVPTYIKGAVAMANTGQPNSNGSQFFVDLANLSQTLPPNYTIFGVVTSGMDIVSKIGNVPTTTNPASGEKSVPTTPVIVTGITLTGS